MSVPVSTSQDPQAALDWSMDWSKLLAANGNATITNATAVSDTVGATVTGTIHSGTVVTWRLACPTIPAGTKVGVTVHVTLSTGEEDERTRYVRIAQR